jgi:nitroreductase
MKNTAQLLNLLLATALVVLAIKITILDTKAPTVVDDATMRTILSRTSVRSYTEKVVESEKVEQLLRAAMAAPTAVNKQPWAFVVITERVLLDTLSVLLPYGKMLKSAPMAIVVCGDLNKALLEINQAYWVQDCSAASQNILLAAQSMGLGAVWTGVYPREDRVADVRGVLNIPNNLVPLNVIPVGYPKGDITPKDKWNTENIYYNRW